MSLLKVKNLTLSYLSHPKNSATKEIKGITFDINPGEIVGLVGVSGSGKTMTSLAIADLLPSGWTASAHAIFWQGKDVSDLNSQQRRKLLGQDIGYIFQDPLSTFNPLQKIGKQITKSFVRSSLFRSRLETKKQTLDLLAKVGFSDPNAIFNAYPHELSGGQRQRALIAGCLLTKPKLLIADEPTTALDTITQSQIIHQIQRLSAHLGISVLFISHDLHLIQKICHRTFLLKDGQTIHSLNHQTPGAFSDSEKICFSVTPSPISNPTQKSSPILLELHQITQGYQPMGPSFMGIKSPQNTNPDSFSSTETGETKDTLHKLSLKVYQGEILGIVGGSGSGKTTLARFLTGLIPAHSGLVKYNDKIIFRQRGERNALLPSIAHFIFQNPYKSLVPHLSIKSILAQPLLATAPSSLAKFLPLRYSITPQMEAQIIKALQEVGLGEEFLAAYPYQLSGGQRQRVAIALNLMISSPLIVGDEIVSALDTQTKQQIIQLIQQLQRQKSLTWIIISHDLDIIRQLCQKIAVMDQGQIVEYGETQIVLSHPQHEATKNLLNAE